MMKKSKINYTPEDLSKAVAEKRADKVYEMIRCGVLEEMDNRELKELFPLFMELRSRDVADLLAKRSHYFPMEMLDIEINNQNDKNFVSYVLDKYGKKFPYKDPDNAARLFEVACKADCKSMLLFLLGKGLAEGEYPRLVSGSDKLLEVLNEVKVKALHPDTIVTFFVEAAVADQNELRIKELIALDFDITTINSEGMNACEVLRRGIENYNYGNDKHAQNEKLRDQQGLKTLERIYSQYCG